MTTYIRDLFDLPDRVRRGDFVLRLTEGVTRAKETVESYVVTPQLANAFDEALGLIQSALDARSSKAAYLHGSFGSGKSHFMAVLHLILLNNGDARSIKELASVIAKHNDWTVGKKFLLVPYHMIGAERMEAAILGGYADHVKRLHPEAATPGVYRSEELFRDARNLRQTMGDAAFFEKLNRGRASGAGATGGWGDIGVGWDAASFDLAVGAAPKAEDRVRLVGDLIETFFSSARGAGEFVDLDTGLSIISKHARSLGYDAVILFLDELILWLASHAADPNFISREGQKLAKLVEAQTPDRPAPIVSFVARQRDLKELVGDQIVGAEMVSFSDVLKWWEARFSKITLEDRNLPAIAEKRVLRPKSEAARQMLEDEFRKTSAIREEVMNVLLTQRANREMFRQVYPFSPALVETLIAVSFFLQRERTALKVMLQLLVEQKDRLKLGEIIPVGDLFDVIAEGDEAFSEALKVHFDNAKKLYEQKLRPMLERENGVSFEEAGQLPDGDLKATALRTDDRLIKTLLLAALAPNVESLRDLTVSKLAALNHGTIKSPIVGRETSIVLGKCRKWAAEVGEIKIGEGAGTDSSVAIQITGVDTDSIIQQAQTEDNQGNRARKIRELVLGQLGVEEQDELFISHDFTWRATKRSCEIQFANIRELGDSAFITTGDEWRIIIDFPFDPEGRGPKDDIARIEKFLDNHEGSSLIVAWIPSFLKPQVQKELGLLVILDFILTGERFSSYVTHLAPVDRAAARSLLENQRSQLRQRMINYLEGAYAVAKPIAGSIDSTYEMTDAEHFQTLERGLILQPPVGPTLKQAFDSLLDQMLRHQFPAHPLFEPETRLNLPTLRRVCEVVERAAQTHDGRLLVEVPPRKETRQIANPLRLGEMHETHFILGHDWKIHFIKKEAEDGGAMTVGKMRTWIDQPKAMGLPRELQNLIILTFAAQTSRSFFLRDKPATAAVDNLPDDYELREQALPAESDWDEARGRSAEIFKFISPPVMNAANVARFVAEMKAAAEKNRESVRRLVITLSRWAASLSGAGFTDAGADSPRYKTAQAAKNLVEAILAAGESDLVRVVAQAEIPSSEAALGVCLRKADEVVSEMERFKWTLVEATQKLADHRRPAAEAIWNSLIEAFQTDEHAIALGPALREVESRAAKLLADTPRAPAGDETQDKTPSAEAAPKIAEPCVQHRVLQQMSRDGISFGQVELEVGALIAEIKPGLEKNPSARLKIILEVYES